MTNLTIYKNYYFEYYQIVLKYQIGNTHDIEYVAACKNLRELFVRLECGFDMLIQIESFIYDSLVGDDVTFSLLRKHFIDTLVSFARQGLSLNPNCSSMYKKAVII